MADATQALQAYEALAQINPLPSVKRHANMDMAQARKVAEDFEAVFISQMMKPMFENTIAEAPFGGGLRRKNMAGYASRRIRQSHC